MRGRIDPVCSTAEKYESGVNIALEAPTHCYTTRVITVRPLARLAIVTLLPVLDSMSTASSTPRGVETGSAA